MKLIAYLVPDDFHDGKLDLPEVQLCLAEHVDMKKLEDVEEWKKVMYRMALAFWRGCHGRKTIYEHPESGID